MSAGLTRKRDLVGGEVVDGVAMCVVLAVYYGLYCDYLF